MATNFYTHKSFYTTQHQDKYDDAATLWPYRTTPLVLPGAKAKRDGSVTTECYLRHHPNPMVRAPPHSMVGHEDILMKQKVADSVLHRVAGDNKVVHKQFNSPIGLYSDANIADTIRHSTGTLPYKPTVVYDPAKSETFRALQEEAYGGEVQAVAAPAQTKVFQPNKVVPGKKPLPAQQQQHHSPINHYANALGDSGEIQQSGSFKRLMHHVLRQGDF